MVLVDLFWMVLAISCIYVACVGGRAERVCLGSYAVASIVSALVISPLPERFRFMEWPMLGVDLSLLLVFLYFLVFSKDYWPLWTTGFQVVSLIANTSVLSRVTPRAYAMSLGILAYAIIATVLVGAVTTHRIARRQRRNEQGRAMHRQH